MSNREIQSYPYTLGNTGILLKSSADEIPITSYAALSNMFTDNENTLTVRRGWARIGTIPSIYHNPNGYLRATTASYRYARSNTDWTRATIGGAYNVIASGLSGSAQIVTTNTLQNIPYVFLADGSQFIKDYGTGLATPVGMSAPSTALSLAFAAVTGADKVEIDNFNSGVASWTPTLLLGTGTTSVSSVANGYVGNAMRCAISDGSSISRTIKNINLDLGSVNDLSVEFYTRFPTETDASNCEKVVVAFSIGDNTFTTRFEKVLQTNPMQQSITVDQYPISVPTSQENWVNNTNFWISIQSGYGLTAEQIASLQTLMGGQGASVQQTVTQYAPVNIPLGSGVWNITRLAKTDFQRIGTTLATDPTLDWSMVKAVSVELVSKVAGGFNFDIDEWYYRAAGQITGSNVSYVYTYYDSLAGTESDYSDIVAVPYPGANKDQFQITFSDTPPVSATHRKLYRVGGTIEQYQLVSSIPIATLTYLDDSLDQDLTDVLNLDNQNIPGVPRGVTSFDNRLFAWGMLGEPPNRLRFSKRNFLETFPTDYWIPVGDGSETIMKCIEFDGELIIFTLNMAYRLIGTDQNSYRAIATRFNQGLMGYNGLAKSTSALYISSNDGIYEYPSGKRISEAINPIWRGQTVNGIPPILFDYLIDVAVGYFNQKVYVSYQSSASDEFNSRVLVYDLGYERWHFYDYGVGSFFSEPADSLIYKPSALLAGVFSGSPSVNQGAYIHQIETGNVDVKSSGSAGITFKVITKELDLGTPDKEKQLIDLVLDIDTNETDVSVYYLLDSGNSSDPETSMTLLGTVNSGSTGRSQLVLPFPDSTGSSTYGKRLQLKLSGITNIDATYDNQIKVYKIIPRFLVEPPLHQTFVTDWSDEGNSNEKIWREMHIEYNSYGQIPTIHLEVDGVDVYSFNATASSYRKKFYYSFPVTTDTTGTKARLRVVMPTGQYIKIYDYALPSIPLSNPITTFETAWSDEGAPNIFKRFRKVIIEVDNIGSGTITVTPEIDGVNLSTYNITATGRKENVYSFPVDTTGYLWRVKISSTTTMRVYSARVEALQDPTHGTTYETPWDLSGTSNRKRYRDIILDIDTANSNVTLTPWIDGVALDTFTVNTPYRMVKILSLPVDTTGILSRITTSGASYHTVYSHRFTYIEEPHFGTIRETPWTDEEYPYDKLWKHVTLDIDTNGVAVDVSFWLDEVEYSTWSITTNGRALVTHSLGQNVIGKLGRITISNTDTQLFSAKFATDREPPDVTSADSYEQTFGYEGWKILKRMYVAIKCLATVTISVYADEILKDEVTVYSNVATGYSKVRVDLNSNIKGKLYRFVFSSPSAFKLYWDKSQVEMKPLNTNDGWKTYYFNPPQTF